MSDAYDLLQGIPAWPLVAQEGHVLPGPEGYILSITSSTGNLHWETVLST